MRRELSHEVGKLLFTRTWSARDEDAAGSSV